jgi:hypothetical protein
MDLAKLLATTPKTATKRTCENELDTEIDALETAHAGGSLDSSNSLGGRAALTLP